MFLKTKEGKKRISSFCQLCSFQVYYSVQPKETIMKQRKKDLDGHVIQCRKNLHTESTHSHLKDLARKEQHRISLRLTNMKTKPNYKLLSFQMGPADCMLPAVLEDSEHCTAQLGQETCEVDS